MNSKVICAFGFSLGVAAGVAASWGFLKRKYEKITNEEVARFKEEWKQYNTTQASSEEPEPEVECENEKSEEPNEMDKYHSILAKNGYTDYSDSKKSERGGEPMAGNRPYVIAPEEFNECDGYETEHLTYYADGVLTNDYDEIFGDVDEHIGIDSLNHFGEYEDDSVYVRNDDEKCDYEILRDLRRYKDIVRKPYQSSSAEG